MKIRGKIADREWIPCRFRELEYCDKWKEMKSG